MFLEDNKFSTNQFVIKTGTIIGDEAKGERGLVVVGNVGANPVVSLFETGFGEGVWHNFGLTLDFNNK